MKYLKLYSILWLAYSCLSVSHLGFVLLFLALLINWYLASNDQLYRNYGYYTLYGYKRIPEIIEVDE
jgi:hypothetical protein